jgi:hypothetical protein
MFGRGFVAAFGMMLPLAAFGQTLWDQEPDVTNVGFPSDGISTNGTQYYSQAIADNFSLSSASNVTGIEFWGCSDHYSVTDLSNFNAFDIYIYNTSFNPVFSTQVSTASLSPVDTGNIGLWGTPYYSLNLTTSINLAAGTYFLHVGSVNVAPQADGFIWANSLSGDNSIYFNAFNSLGWQNSVNNGDMAFKLTGSPAPEPASLCFLALGGLAFVRRRRG